MRVQSHAQWAMLSPVTAQGWQPCWLITQVAVLQPLIIVYHEANTKVVPGATLVGEALLCAYLNEGL
eukprot:3331847-Amphidinium_carterae.1